AANSCNDSIGRTSQGPGGHWGRRTSHDGQYGRQEQRQENPQAVQRQDHHGLCRLHGRRLFAARTVRGKAGGLRRQHEAGGHRTGQRLAHRPLPAPPRSHAHCRLQRRSAGDFGHGRRAGARQRHCFHRFGQHVCPVGGHRPRKARPAPDGRGDRDRKPAHRRRHLHLHQPQPDRGESV
ncbi:MAG: ATP-dependent protease subunit HslV, partial [uncultured Cytophagales bacterium]